MGKINIILTVNDLKKELKGIKTNGKIIFFDKDIKTIIEGFNYLKIKRYSKEYELELYFELNKYTNCNIKVNNKILNFQVFTNKLKILDNIIELEYLLDDSKFKITLEM